jgi:hypothetical protein
LNISADKSLEMKKTDKLKHERYVIFMKIIDLESKEKRMKLTKNESSELTILREKLEELERRLKELEG